MAAVDRVAVLAALNLAHELQLLGDRQSRGSRPVDDAVANLHRKLDALDAEQR